MCLLNMHTDLPFATAHLLVDEHVHIYKYVCIRVYATKTEIAYLLHTPIPSPLFSFPFPSLFDFSYAYETFCTESNTLRIFLVFLLSYSF